MKKLSVKKVFNYTKWLASNTGADIVDFGKTTIYRNNPLSSYNRIEPSDLDDFAELNRAWRPDDGKQGVFLRWHISLWCNFRCLYCNQSHHKNEKTHAFSNHGVSEWVERLEKHFKDSLLALVITGGEPMLDKKNMVLLLGALSKKKWVDSIHIDTNLSWNLKDYALLNLDKIHLMCTFHPTQMDSEKFISRIESALEAGWRIGMINYVMHEEQLDLFEERWKIFADMGIPLHPNPLWNSNGNYSEKAMAIQKKYLPEVDFNYKCELISPHNKKCFYPAIAYEMRPTGKIFVGCHRFLSGTLFDEKIPKLPSAPVRCPHMSCECADKYSFLTGIDRNTSLNPFRKYHELLMEKVNEYRGLRLGNEQEARDVNGNS